MSNNSYTTQLPQYPSQSEGFLSLDVGSPRPGPKGSPNSHFRGRGGPQQQSNANVAPFYQNTHNRNTPYFKNRGSFNNFSNNRQFGGNANGYQGQRRGRGGQGQRWSGGDGDGRGFGGQNRQRNFQKPVEGGSNRYVHPSMTEDPWKQLLENHNSHMQPPADRESSPAELTEAQTRPSPPPEDSP